MNIFDLQATITLDSSGFMSGVGQAQAAMNSLAGGTDTKSVAIGTAIGNMATQAAGALVDFGKEAMQTGMSFDSSMANVGAISGATADELDALRAKAKEMGASTKFTATEAADAFSYMAMAGWDASQMMDGIAGIMNLAAASGEDLATTSDIVTDALTAFGLKAEDSGHFADVLAAASSAANTNVHMMGETFKYVAPVAGALGYSVEDMATAIGTMANSGIKGSQAGTALRAALNKLIAPAQSVLDELGIMDGIMTDSSGNTRSFSEVVDILRGAFSKLSEAQQAEYASTLFGQEAMSGMLAIINTSTDDYDKLADTIGASSEAMGGMGTAAAMAEKQLANLPGQLTLMDSAFDGLKTAVYEKIKNPLEEMAGVATGVFSDLTAAVNDGGILGAFESLGGILAENLGPAFGDIADKIAPFKEALSGLADSIGDGFSDSLGTISGSVKSFIDAFAEADFGTMDGVAQAAARLVDAFKNAAADRMEAVATGVSAFVDAFRDVGAADAIGRVAQGAKDLLAAFLTASADVVESVSESVLNFVGGFVNGGGAEAIANVAKSTGEFLSDFLIASETTIKAVSEGTAAFLQGFDEYEVGEAVANLAEASGELFHAISSTSGEALKDVAEGVDALVHAGGDKIESAGRGASALAVAFAELGAAIAGGFAGAVEAVGNAFSGMGAKLGEIVGRFGPDVGRLGAALADFVSICTEFGTAVENAFAPVREWLTVFLVQALQAALSMLIGSVGAIIDTITPIAEFFNATLHAALDAFKGDWQAVWDDGKAAAKAFADFIEGLGDIIIRPFQAIIPQMRQIGADIINGLWNGLKEMWSNVSGWFENTIGGLISSAKNLLGIGSPSKVFAEIGKFTVQGMEVGWRSEFGHLENQVDRDVRRLTDTARIGFEDSAIGRSSAAGISSMFAASEGSGRGDPVSINLVLDGDVAATALYDPLRRTAFQRGQNSMEAAYA